MALIRIMAKDKDDLREYKKALKMAKKGIETLCDLSEEMEDTYDERDYDGRYKDWDERRRHW